MKNVFVVTEFVLVVKSNDSKSVFLILHRKSASKNEKRNVFFTEKIKDKVPDSLEI